MKSDMISSSVPVAPDDFRPFFGVPGERREEAEDAGDLDWRVMLAFVIVSVPGCEFCAR